MKSKVSFRWNGVPKANDIQNVSRIIEDNNIEIVDLKFNDLPGLWQHFSIPASELTEIDDPVRSIWEEGIGFDGSSIRGFQKIQESDMILLPDPKSARVDPVCDVPTLTILVTSTIPFQKSHIREIRVMWRKRLKHFLSQPALQIRASGGLRWSFSSSTIYGSTKPLTAGTILSTLMKENGILEETRNQTWVTKRDIKKDIFLSLPMTRSRI